MEKQIVKILSTECVTHNVKQFKFERPSGLTFIPGQAADISINTAKWENEKRPFTFTGLPDWDYLEFTIKIYNDHKGVTEQLGKLKEGDEIILHDVFGAIHYYGEGTFIAGGAGITPFIAIFRQLEKENILGNNRLIFSNNTEKDIIMKNEFARMLGDRFINTLTQEKTKQYDNRVIDEKYLSEKIDNFSQYFYLCGPDPMVDGIQRSLAKLGVDAKYIIVEQF
jgi:propane monooxygenase reductase component